MSRVTRAGGRDGYITLAVLVMAGIMAGLVSTLLLVSRPSLGLARVQANEVAARGLLDAGLTASGYLLYPGKRDRTDVNALTLRFDTGLVKLSVADEAGRIDLNTADPKLLAGLYTAAGGKSMDAEAFAARVQDWRDEDSDVTNNGAEANEYSGVKLPYAPRNAPFRSVDELRYLLGLSGADFARLAPYVTTYNQTGMIDAFSAQPAVLQAVPDLDPGDLAKLVKAHNANAEERKAFADLLGKHGDALLTEPSGVYRVGIEARLKNGFTQAAEAVISTPPDDSKDFAVLAWTRLAPPAQQH